MHNLENLKDRLCRELDEYASRGKMDMNTIQIIDTIAHTVKNLNKIIECEEEKEGYSQGPRVHGNYSFGDNYNYGYNYNGKRTMVYLEVNERPDMNGYYYVDDCCGSYSVVDFYYDYSSNCPFQY
jgi:hypothetical protein